MSNILEFIKKFATLISRSAPALFFIGGFAWDALTIGHQVAGSDLLIFGAYLLFAAIIMYHLAQPWSWAHACVAGLNRFFMRFEKTKSWDVHDWPYFVIQFLFGSLLSALFILYFKSASYALAWWITLVLGVLLVANEFLESHYRRFTLCWGMFGLCAMLLLNFAFPFVLGSVHVAWFYLSTLAGAGATHYLYVRSPRHSGNIWPVWLMAVVLMLAYNADMIPPVPLVKRHVVVGYQVEKQAGDYIVTVQATPWWNFWQKNSDELQPLSGQAVYCFSSVFAPPNLQTKLYHDWQYKEKKGWVTYSRVGFSLNGGRFDGYRGYTYKQNLVDGEWRVLVETETHKTIASHAFTVKRATQMPDTLRLKY